MNAPAPRDKWRHEEIWLLLPWYVNGTLDAMEAARVRHHLRGCQSCRDEIAAQRRVRLQVHSAAPAVLDVDSALAKLKARIGDEPLTRPRNIEGPDYGGILARLKRWLNPHGRHPLAWVAAAGLLAAVVLPQLLELRPAVRPNVFHTSANPGSFAQFEANDIRVVFARPLASAAVESIIGPLRGRVLDGPTDLGVYTIRFDVPKSSPEFVSSLIERLRANKDVALAEPALPPSGPWR